MNQNLPPNASKNLNFRDSANSYEVNRPYIYPNPFYHQLLSSPCDPQYLKNNSNNQKNWSRSTEPLTHSSYDSSRAYPATVSWLLENYESAEGVSLPRFMMYFHYKQHCEEMNFLQMNQASFGKLIRSVFFGLRTRRLGTRGNSKYHYYGIRIKRTSKLNQIKEEIIKPRRNQPCKIIPMHEGTFSSEILICELSGDQGHNSDDNDSLATQDFAQKFPRTIPEFYPIPSIQGLDGFSIFETNYKNHCIKINEAVAQLNFKAVVHIWRDFWCNLESSFNSSTSNRRFREIVSYEGVSTYIFKTDCKFYQHLLTSLIPNFINELPGGYIQKLRTFSKSVEFQLGSVLRSAKYEGNIVFQKLRAVGSFAQLLHRHTKLYYLAQSTKRKIENISHCEVMFSDISQIDILEIHQQLHWLCNCKAELVSKVFESFKNLINHMSSVDELIGWLNETIELIFPSPKTSPETWRQFLLTWSLYASMVIRDLTLRSSPSFVSFHALRMFFDEYLQYLVKERVASSLETTPIGLIAERLTQSSQTSPYL